MLPLHARGAGGLSLIVGGEDAFRISAWGGGGEGEIKFPHMVHLTH